MTYLTEFNKHVASHLDAEVIRDNTNDYVSHYVSVENHREYVSIR